MDSPTRFQSICENFGSWVVEDENSAYNCFAILFLKTFLPLLLILASIVYVALISLFKADVYVSACNRLRSFGNQEESRLLNDSNPIYSTFDNSSVPTQIQKFLIPLETYNALLCYLTKFQLVSTLLIGFMSAFTTSLETTLFISLTFWTFTSLLCHYNRNLDYLILLRILFFAASLMDFSYLRVCLVTKFNSIQLYVKIFTAVSVLIDFVLLVQSFLMCSSVAQLNDLAKLSKVYPSPESHASILSILTFSWVQPLLAHGYSKIIEPVDIWDLRFDEKAGYLSERFDKFTSKGTFFTKIFLMFRYELFLQFIFAMVSLSFNFLTPVLFHQFLLLVESSSSANSNFNSLSSVEYGFILVVGMLFTVVFKSMADSQSLFYGRRIGVRVKAIVLAQVYSKTLRKRESTAVDDIDVGKITNFMSVDAHDISETCAFLSFLYIIPVQLLISAYYLYVIMGWPALVGIALTFVVMPLNYLIFIHWDKIQTDLMECSDKRLDLLNELLQGIRIIKFFAWENQFKTRVSALRRDELRALLQRMSVWIINVILWFCFPMFITFTTFYTLTKVAGLTLTASIAFTSLAIFNQLREVMDMLPETINMLLEARVSLGRIDSFLTLDESKKYDDVSMPTNTQDPILGFRNATVSWGPDLFTLKDLNVNFPPEQLSLVIGPTGSGKTSLLNALLGELYLSEGAIYLPSKKNALDLNALNGGIAYVSQTAWLQQDTIRNNILFGEPYDADRYQETVECCALVADLQNFEDGDLTEIGEKGITLSGGQKQRVAIARAVYSRAKHIIFDDPLSAVDAHTAKTLFNKCILGKLLRHRTRILVTHNVALTFNKADYIVQLSAKGQIIFADSKAKVEQLPEFLSFKEGLKAASKPILHESGNNLKPQRLDTYLSINPESESKATKLILEEERAKGSVKFKVYRFYIESAGGRWFGVGLLLVFSIYQLIPLFSDYWLKNWAQAGSQRLTLSNFPHIPLTLFTTIFRFKPESTFNLMKVAKLPDSELNFYIQIYLFIMALSVCSVVLSVAYQFWGSMNASRRLHDSLLESVLKAPIRFFDTTPVGRLVNRFSQDLQAVDQEVMSSVVILLSELLASVFVLGMIVYIVPQFLVVGIVIAFIFFQVTMYYLGGSRELKRIESTTLSPIYSQCGETILGVTTIRAFEQTDRFKLENFAKVNANLRCYFYIWAANSWLSIRSEFVGGLVILTTGTTLLMLRDHIHPTFMGLAFTYALNFSTHIFWLARFYSDMELDMNSVERIQEYLDLPSEPEAIIENHRPPPNWPSTGQININDLILRYAADLDPVLNNISLSIKGGEKVGVVGRTGAGKSTLALALFRFLDPDHGSIFIDGVSIHHIGIYDLRSNLTIIPQDAVLFAGTIRTNLDPFQQYTDGQLWKVLQQAHLTEDQAATETGSLNSDSSEAHLDFRITSLEMQVADNGSNFSQGQRQLLALARALLRPSKVIVMDEATASVDYTTDSKIQLAIRESFSDCTLICIAHRLQTVIDYDKVLVLNRGMVQEFDTPKKLLENPDGAFYELCAESGELERLLQLVNK